MRFGFLIALGLVFAAGLGFAAHLIARDTVALPASSIQAGEGLAPAAVTTRTADDHDHGNSAGWDHDRDGRRPRRPERPRRKWQWER
jgi:hypothetical protein